MEETSGRPEGGGNRLSIFGCLCTLMSSSLRLHRLIVSSYSSAYVPSCTSSSAAASSSQASVTCRPLIFNVSADRLYVRGSAGVLRGFMLTQPLACTLCLTSFGLPAGFSRDLLDSRTGQDAQSKSGTEFLPF